MIPYTANKTARSLNGEKTSRSTVTDIPCNLHDLFMEHAVMNGLNKREAMMIGMILFLKRANVKPPKFPEKAYLYARLKKMRVKKEGQ